MTQLSQPLTPTEAAVVSEVTVREVNRVIDEKILPPAFYAADTPRLRRVEARACPLIAFYFGSAARLTAEQRLKAIIHAGARLAHANPRTSWKAKQGADWTLRDEFLTIDLAPFVRATWERFDRLNEAREAVVEDPGILSGTPVLRGTRVPVYDVAATVEKGISIERILEAYPSLDAEKVALAALYARAVPLRGRPRQPRRPPGATVISRLRLPRRDA